MTSFEPTPDPLQSPPGPRAPIDRIVELTCSEDDRTRFELAGIGWLQTGGHFGGSEVNVHAGGVTWQCGKSGFFGTVLVAKNHAGEVDGRFAGALFGSGGTVNWAGLPPYKLQKTGLFRARYLLMDGQMILCEFGPGPGGDAPAVVHLRREGIPAGLVMFGTYLARELRRRQGLGGGTGGGSFESSSGGGCGGGGGGCGGGGS